MLITTLYECSTTDMNAICLAMTCLHSQIFSGCILIHRSARDCLLNLRVSGEVEFTAAARTKRWPLKTPQRGTHSCASFLPHLAAPQHQQGQSSPAFPGAIPPGFCSWHRLDLRVFPPGCCPPGELPQVIPNPGDFSQVCPSPAWPLPHVQQPAIAPLPTPQL